jgi:HlyD family secretion protein
MSVTEAQLPRMQAPMARTGRPWARWLILLACLVVVTSVFAKRSSSGSGAPPPPPAELPPLTRVAALGRLEPMGGSVEVSVPSGAGDAVIDELFVEVGDRVERGAVLAALDSSKRALAMVARAETELEIRAAELERAMRGFAAERREAEAGLAAANARLGFEASALQRSQHLVDSHALPASELAERRLSHSVAAAEVERAQARLARLPAATEQSPDVRIARRQLAAARASLAIAQVDLERTKVLAPRAGVVLSVLTRAGERPRSGTVLRLGQTDSMTARLEVHQSQVRWLRSGLTTTLRADAFDGALVGTVTRIGQEVRDQLVTGADPVARHDARVVEVEVTLDARSSRQAGALTNVQVLGDIELPEVR